MLNLTFPAITNGYISAAELQGTLSCQLNAMLMRKLILKEQLCFYPQRIPRSDFFDELFQHESEFFQLEFNKINDLFLNEILSLLKSSPEQIGSNCFNIMNIMMRRNCVESLYKLLSNFTINSNDFNARFLWETIKIELDLNLNRSITLSGYHCLGREILKVDPFAFTNAVQIANRIIVCAKRHLRKYDENNLLPYYKYCFNYLNSIKKDTFEQVLLKSKCH